MDVSTPQDMQHSEFSADINAMTGAIVDSAFRVRKELGAGLLERVYAECLCIELRERGFDPEMEVPASIRYRGHDLGRRLRMDLVVNRGVLVEVKAVEHLHPIHFAQTLTYLRLSNLPVALLINFNAVPLRDGIHRLVRSSSETC